MKKMAERVHAIEVRAFENFKKRGKGSSSMSKLCNKLELGFKYNPNLAKQKKQEQRIDSMPIISR